MQKILILNDCSGLLEILEIILFHRGYYVISNVSLPDLTAVILKHKPGLMVLHYISNRPEMKMYHEAIQKNPFARQIPLLVIAQEGETFNDFTASKNNYFVPKRLNTKDLVETIENLLKDRY